MNEVAFHAWVPIVALLSGMAVAALLYYANSKQHYPKSLTITLFILRTLLIAGVVLLLINPFVTLKKKSVEQPTVIVLRDNSASIALANDSALYRGSLDARLKELRKSLGKRYDIDGYIFGDSLRKSDDCDYSDNTTNVSDALSQIKRLYYKRNVGAVLLLSDGIVNSGTEVEQVAADFPFPVHALLMGDTTHSPDIIVKDIRANSTAAVGNVFPIQALVAAENCKGTTMIATLYEDDKEIASKQMLVSSDRFAKEEIFFVTAKVPKIHHYKVTLSGVEDEKTITNNTKSVFVDVKSHKYKVLVLAKSPNPDIAALQSVMRDEYDVQVNCGSTTLPDLADMDMLVVYGILPDGCFEAVENQLQKMKKLPVLFVQGDEVSIEQFNSLQNTFQLKEGSTHSMLSIKALHNTGFPLFTLADAKKVNDFPPLSLPMMEIISDKPNETLLFQQVLGVNSTLPLLSFSDNGRKMAFIFGSGIWRWRLFDFYQNQNHDLFDDIVSKTLKYLVVDADDGFVVRYNEAYYGGADVVMTAVVRNASNELVDNADVKLKMTNMSSNEEYEYNFYNVNGEYEVNAGRMPEGAYHFVASTEVGGRKLSKNGVVEVLNAGIEGQYLVANKALMSQVAALTGGTLHSLPELEQVEKMLLDDDSLTSIERVETRYIDLMSVKWLIFIVLAIAAIEWLLRKMFGSY